MGVRAICVLLMLAAICAARVNAEPATVRVDPALDHMDLSASTYVLEDPEGKLSLADIQSSAHAGLFQLRFPKIGRSPSVFWLRYTMASTATRPSTWWLDSGGRTLQEADVYAPDEHGVYQHQSAGANRRFADRPLPTGNFVFALVLPPDRSVDIYLRIRSPGYMSFSGRPQIWKPAAHQLRANTEKTQWLLYLGMAAALGVFNLLLFFSIRDTSYLLYVLSLLSVAWGVCSSQGGFGAAYELLWPDSPVFEQVAWIAPVSATAFFTGLFSWRFIDLPRLRPRLHAFLKACLALILATHGSVIAVLALQLPHSAWLVQPAWLVGLSAFVVFFVASSYGSIALALAGNRSAFFLCIAWSPLTVSLGISLATATLSGQQSDRAVLMWASALELVLMALALADRFNQEKKARAQAQSELVAGLRQSERELEGKVQQRTLELQHEQTRTKDLLHNILPVELAQELSATGAARPARHESVTILFTDFKGFTQAASTMPADRMVAELNEIFAAFDDITDACGVEKIKTIGDAYMAAAGLPKPCADHAQRCVRAGLRMVAYLENRNRTAAFKWSVRIGVHSGPVVAGVVGKRKYAFDIWGDTVNVASRMESSGDIGRVNISAYTCDLVRAEFECEYRGKVDAKGKGQMDMYFVTGETREPQGASP